MKIRQTLSLLCDQCSFMAEPATDMRKYVEDHNPFAFECLQCDFKTKNNIFLKMHIKHKHTCHEKLLCDECDFTTNKNRKLVTHKEKKHLNLSLTCEICGFVTTYGQSVRDHKRKTHSSVRYQVLSVQS